MHKLKERFAFHKTGFRLLKIAHSIDTLLIPVSLLECFFQIIVTFLSLFLSADLIDALLNKDYRMAAVYALLLIILNMILGIAGHFLRKEISKSSTRCTRAFTKMLREKMMTIDYELVEEPKITEKIRFAERSAQMQGGLSEVVRNYTQLFKNAVTMAASVGMVFSLCLKTPAKTEGILGLFAGKAGTVLIFLSVLGVSIWLSKIMGGRYLERMRKSIKEHTGVEIRLGYLADNIFMNYKAAKVIRIFGMEEMLIKNGREELAKTNDYFAETGEMERGKAVAQTASNSLFVVVSYILVAVKIITGAVSVGSFTKYVGALNQFGTAFSAFTSDYVNLEQICAYLKEFLNVLDIENIHTKGTIPVEKRLDGEYEIAFEDVSFHYPGNEELVLEHVNCKLNMKRKMAVVGRNGAGKTTFIKLLCRLYEPTEGRITLNGIDIRKYKEEEYRDLFGVVFQDFKLFSFPVWENVATGLTREDEKIWKCLAQAGAAEIVENMKDGLDTYLYKHRGDGVEISGGEAQKIALARALYKDAPLVILDEPTAALDPISEAEIYAGFDEMVKDKTSIYISHRMSSCRFCDDIIVFDKGQIAERGSHEALLSAGGQYARLWNAQAKYYTS